MIDFGHSAQDELPETRMSVAAHHEQIGGGASGLVIQQFPHRSA